MFGVGFVFRPLGGIVIGAFADRAGRRPAMLLTIVLITVGTMGLALTPSYASIGVAAPVIVIFCRLVQGLALGGEVGPASVFLIEAAPNGKRGLYSSWQLASQGIAVLAAGILGLGLSLVLDKPALTEWGWRVPFVLCLLLVPVAFYLRREMPETYEPGPQSQRAHLGDHVKLIVLAVLLILGGTVSTYVSNYMTTCHCHAAPAAGDCAHRHRGRRRCALRRGTGGWMAGGPLWPACHDVVAAPYPHAHDVAAVPVAGAPPERRYALSRNSRADRPDCDRQHRLAGLDPGAAAALDPFDRPVDRLRRGRVLVRWIDAIRHHLAIEGDQRPDVARLVRDDHQHHHARRHVGHARKPRPGYRRLMPGKPTGRGGTILVMIVLLGLLALAIYMGVAGWNMGSDGTGQEMSTAGYIAMALGVVVTLALGAGLMALMYYSSKHDRD